MDILQELNWGLITPIIILQLILMTFALVNCFRSEATNGPKWVWVLVIIFINIIGPILYFVFGRRND
ncbi:PLDc N-terminal domain-containing protein [Alkalihalobacillus pseudalcaliphilus]|uniref:PLDc N-terminal domain-containing protein n=1 Tax=Alkalihalobacillus pseudalcaliphilus TaxID=79884 RepID=UPI00064DB27E|nr:PLDc N-terminal domain-containing protein [Alkalihalobacillus pseudalcaliphilus]KMK75592.1 Negative regulatory protein YxlE [Alkalihalobacillus pseudalcaliphilus]